MQSFSAPDISSPDIHHAFFTRQGGVSAGIYAGLNCGPGSADDPDHVAENRERARHLMDAEHLVSLHQVHSADVVTITGPVDPANRPKADGMVSNIAGVALGILTADCGPVLFSDPHAGVIGACHAGWGGAFRGVLENTVAAMVELGADPDDITAALGPTLAQESYEIGPEFRDRFEAEDKTYTRFFARPSGKERDHFDLPAFISAKLDDLVGQHHILGRDTYAEPDNFYSYRRSVHRGEADYGRLLSAITIRHD